MLSVSRKLEWSLEFESANFLRPASFDLLLNEQRLLHLNSGGIVKVVLLKFVDHLFILHLIVFLDLLSFLQLLRKGLVGHAQLLNSLHFLIQLQLQVSHDLGLALFSLLKSFVLHLDVLKQSLVLDLLLWHKRQLLDQLVFLPDLVLQLHDLLG